MDLKRWKPAVENRWLLLLAGVLWSVVGLALCVLAYGWLMPIPRIGVVPLVTAGVILALLMYRFSFSKIASKNIRRICQMTGRVCLFAFQAWMSYLIAVVMIGLGVALRNSGIPKPDLAVLYIGIGGGLLLSSLHYYKRLLQIVGPQPLSRSE